MRLIADHLQDKARPDLRGREQAGRERQPRHRCGRQGRARRLHARPHDRRPARHQHAAVRQAALRSRRGPRLDHHGGDPAERARRQRRARCQHGGGTDRCCCRHNPGKYNFGSIGNGSLSHLAMEAIALKSGTQIVHVPYPSSPAGDDGAAAQRRADGLPAGDLRHAAARLRQGEYPRDLDGAALGAAARRSDPEGGGVDVEVDAWNGLIAPAKTPDAIVAAVRPRGRRAHQRRPSAKSSPPSSWSRSRPPRRNSAPASTPTSRAGHR